MIALLTEQRAFDYLVLLHVHLEVEVALANRAAKNLHEVLFHMRR